MAYNSNSTDDGPQFVSSLIKDINHIKRQQNAIEEKLLKINREQILFRRKLASAEETLKTLGEKEATLDVFYENLKSSKTGHPGCPVGRKVIQQVQKTG